MIPKIIFDTDIGGDCDDAVALAIALELMKTGECELLAVTSCTESEAPGGCIESILRYYGYGNLPIGCFRKDDGYFAPISHDVYATKTAMKYENRFRNGEHYENTVKLLRKIIAETSEPITIVATGAFTSLAKLLESGPDEASDLNGVELVRQKSTKAVCMGGRFTIEWPEPILVGDYVVEAEWNIRGDIPGAQITCEKWPGELILSSYEIGLPIITGQELQVNGPENNPVRTCYEIWHEENGGSPGRETWDGTTMLHAIRPNGGYWNLHEYGRIHVDDIGRTIWSPEEGGLHTFLTDKIPSTDIENEINAILNRDILRSKA